MTNASAGRRYGGRAPAARTAERRARFIAAGIEVFGTVGYQGATVRRLCAAAGLTDRYYYESFGGPDELLRACYADIMEGLRTRLDRIMTAAGDDLDRLIDEGLDAFFETMRDPRVARIALLQVLGVSPAVDRMYNENSRQFGALITDLIARAQPDRPLENPELLGVTLVGALSSAAQHWMLNDYQLPRAALIAVGRQLLRGAVRLPDSPPRAISG